MMKNTLKGSKAFVLFVSRVPTPYTLFSGAQRVLSLYIKKKRI